MQVFATDDRQRGAAHAFQGRSCAEEQVTSAVRGQKPGESVEFQWRRQAHSAAVFLGDLRDLGAERLEDDAYLFLGSDVVFFLLDDGEYGSVDLLIERNRLDATTIVGKLRQGDREPAQLDLKKLDAMPAPGLKRP
ncbi:MAG: hypothetical protein ACYTG0_46595, partial [Planctomycetota bacterium]